MLSIRGNKKEDFKSQPLEVFFFYAGMDGLVFSRLPSRAWPFTRPFRRSCGFPRGVSCH